MKIENQPYSPDELGVWGTPAMTSRIIRWWEGKTKSAGGILPEKDGEQKWEIQKNQYKTINRRPSSEGFNDMVETNIMINQILFKQARKLGLDELEYKKEMISLFLKTIEIMNITTLPTQKEQEKIITEIKHSFQDGLTLLFQK
jgi:hypothetical protein